MKSDKTIAAIRRSYALRLLKLPQLLLLVMHNRSNLGWQAGELAKLIECGNSAITGAKILLMGVGLVEEHTPHRDQRVTRLYLTQAGQERASQLWEAMCGMVASEAEIIAGPDQ